MTLNHTTHGSVALLELNRPEVRNALSTEALDTLLGVLRELTADDRCRAIVLAGAGPSFCAGADLTELRSFDDEGFAAYVERYRTLGDVIRGLGKPLIAAVHGHAIAGGYELMCLADLRIVATDAKLRVGDLDIGLSPTSGLTWILPRLVGFGRARWLLLAGPTLSGEQAVGIGLAEEAVAGDALRDRALAVATRIAAHPGLGVRRTLELLNDSADSTYDEAVAAELVAEYETFAHPESRAAVEAFFRRA
jgi:2-(1,2-epoxy-1,2-dihydrophenyl)acetyl-CoA isomerase